MTGCKSSDQGKLAGKLMALSEEARKELGAKVPPAGSAGDQLEDLIDKAKERVRGKSGREVVEALNRLIFTELGFLREVEDDSIEFTLLPYVVANRKGSCLGLAGLYLVIAERLKLPVRGVLVPGHFFLKLKERNIELLRKGEAMPDEWYREKWRVPEKATAYMRPLAEKELLAVFLFNLGNAYRLKGDYPRARKAYQRVIESFPDFAEAHANLGLVFQLQKDYPGAERSYLKARSLQPELPGLAENIKVLHVDMGK